MKLEELEEAMRTPRDHHLVLFLPFVRLKTSCTVAGVDFVPLRDADGKVPPVLDGALAALEKILSGYIDRHGEPLDNCVVGTIPGRGWDLDRSDFPVVTWATSLLYLASWSCNDYYPRFGGDYVNSSNFRVVGQAYSGSMPGYIAVSARRRDGSTTDGGYEHGEFKFSLPLQVSIREAASVDMKLLAALDAANASGSTVIDRLRTALPFVELANTDDEFMTEHAEAILMGSAFEQLLAGDASAYKLGKRFGELFGQFGCVTVDDARKERQDIQIDTSTPEIAAAQPKWWVHRKWMEELYDVRSKVVHKGDHSSRSWGWQIGEHLVMAAHVFPLTVKLMLEKEGHYAPTDEDRGACLATDLLLVEKQWVEDRDGRTEGRFWHEVIYKTRSSVRFDSIWQKYKEKHPELFQSDSDEPASAGS
jgi:hypothetical protein